MLKNILRPAAGNRVTGDGGGALSPMAARCRFLDEHVFIHTHIEKTAGSALVQGLAAIVGWSHTVDVRGDGSISAAGMSAEDRALTRLYSGHFDYGVHRHFTQRPLYVAAVRPPVDRAVSYYRYGVERTGHPNHKRFSAMDFKSAFNYLDRKAHAVARNGQVQRVMGEAYRDDLSEDEIARHVREAYFAIVPQPRVGAIINAIRKALDLPVLPLAQFNVGKGPEVVLERPLRRRINRCNAADVALLDHVRTSFSETVERVQDYIAEGARGARH